MMIAEAIAAYLKANGIPHSELSRMTGLSRDCISLSLEGRRNFSIDEYTAICSALRLPYQYFFDADSKAQ